MRCHPITVARQIANVDENGPVPPADHNSTDGQCSPSFSEFIGMKIGKLAPPEQDKNSRPFKIS
jgi:hypothetical protein